MKKVEPSVQRWPRELQPDPGAIEDRMKAEGIPYYRWSNGPWDLYGAHHLAYLKIIYVLQGSIVFGLPA